MNFRQWIKLNHPNLPECGPNYMILQQIWQTGATSTANLIKPEKLAELLEEFEKAKKEEVKVE